MAFPRRYINRILFTLGMLPVILFAVDTPSPFYDFRGESQGTVHKITVADLPSPNSPHPGEDSPEPEPRPADAMPRTLPGFKVNLFASDLNNPRELRRAPNGDVFLAEMRAGQ